MVRPTSLVGSRYHFYWACDVPDVWVCVCVCGEGPWDPSLCRGRKVWAPMAPSGMGSVGRRGNESPDSSKNNDAPNFRSSEVWNEIRKCALHKNSDVWTFGNLSKVRKFGDVKIWKYGNVEDWKVCEFGNLRLWKFKRLHVFAPASSNWNLAKKKSPPNDPRTQPSRWVHVRCMFAITLN